MKSRVLLTIALLVGAVLLARLSLREEPTEVTALEPSERPVTADLGATREVEPLPPSERRSEAAPSDTDGEERSEPTTPRDAELPTVEILVLHERSGSPDVPLPGVRVFHVESASIGRTLLGTTDAGGRLRTKLSSDRPRRLEADPATLPNGVSSTGSLKSSLEHHLLGRIGAVPAPDEMETITLRLPSAGALVVTARGPDGRPVPGAVVDVWSRSTRDPESVNWSRVGRAARTDDDGVAVLEDLHVGELCVGIDARNTISSPPPPPQRITLAPAAREQLTFEVGTGQVVVRGRVVDETGVPVPGVAIDARYDRRGPGAPLPQRAAGLRPSARAGQSVTDEAGWFQLEELGAGPYLLFFDLGPVMARLDERRLLPAPMVVRAVAPTGDHALLLAVDDVVVPRIELFVVKGHVVLDGDRLGQSALGFRDLRPRIEGNPSADEARCDYDPRTGAFEAVCRLPLEHLTLVLQPRQRGVGTDRPREFPFVPEAGLVLEDVELRYP